MEANLYIGNDTHNIVSLFDSQISLFDPWDGLLHLFLIQG